MTTRLEIIEVSSREEADLLVHLAREIWTEHYTPIIGASQVDYMLDKFQSVERVLEEIRNEDYRYRLARWDGKMAGYYAYLPNYELRGTYLSKAYVAKSFRGNGLLRSYISLIAEEAKKEQLNHIWLSVNKNNTESIAAYKKVGFQISAEITTDIGAGFVMDDYVMRLEI